MSQLELYREHPPKGEDTIISEFVDHDTRYHEKDYPASKRPVQRRLHVKNHGCVHARFSVLDDLPERLKVGVFSQPREYDAIVRFSNGLRRAQADKEPDARGMAIKLFGVAGKKLLEDEPDATTHDFTLLNHPTFFVRNAKEFSAFSRTVDRFGNPLPYLLGWNPFKWHLKEFWTLFWSTRPIRSPVAVRYFSQSPFRLGNLAVKYSAKPTLQNPLCNYPKSDPDYLRKNLVDQLALGSVDFDFSIQVQADANTMPIEDTLVRWSESRAPFVRVARLHIPAQVFDTEARRVYCEHLSYTSWHALPEHQPLGGVNRMRREAYRASSILRHRMNSQARQEPTDFQAFVATAG